MQKKQHLILLIIYFLTLCVNAQETNLIGKVSLLTTQKEFRVSDEILLDFGVKDSLNFNLYCSNSYGSLMIHPYKNDGKVTFRIPKFLSKKRGLLTWKTIGLETNISGSLFVNSLQQPKTIETYLGPPSIDAGAIDYTMLVVIPTDSLDNPIKDNSKVDVKNQFLKSERSTPIFTDKLIGYKNIYSPLKSGRMIISSESYGLNSKEFDVNIMPAIATNFKIYAKRNHEYADGNQITTFYTSVIKDRLNNVIIDGSFIEFYITNKKGNILKTTGTTINGVAHAKIIHPDFEENWSVKAYSIGISESNVINLKFKKVIDNYIVDFNNNNRTIKVGPLESFMGQIIPDGLIVKLFIYKDKKLIETIFKESNAGFAEFNLNPNIFEDGIYDFKTKTAGIEKEFNGLKVW
ncbi:hypothetical protein BXQ17_03625 [Polaribacter sp. BM10]|uniref:hypothetical protein n=1 Tax=Polaribacter sp. BM10 TaxID=1529069 RepID=UPI00098ABFFE|nr:hypothetical protein [Polaribacter sp. BM10]AQS93221.1 hypothetical protein BXQ17_03625 [Polaribacter sp. BM10]